MSLTPLPPPPPLLEKYIFFALPSMNGPLPAELKFRENPAFSIPSIHKTRTFSRIFYCHEMHLLFLLGLFTEQHDRTSFPFIYLNSASRNPSTLPCTRSLMKVHPFWAELPCIGHQREYSRPGDKNGFISMLALCTKKIVHNISP